MTENIHQIVKYLWKGNKEIVIEIKNTQSSGQCKDNENISKAFIDILHFDCKQIDENTTKISKKRIKGFSFKIGQYIIIGKDIVNVFASNTKLSWSQVNFIKMISYLGIKTENLTQEV